SFETNIDGSDPKIVDEQVSEEIAKQQQQEQQDLTSNERHRNLSLSAKSLLPSIKSNISSPLGMVEQLHSDSFTSPEASIDV
ncbi:unnamed protein product, partial [Rotaria magnacalcarata]